MRDHRTRFMALGISAAIAAAIAGCGSSSGGGGGSNNNNNAAHKSPLLIGASVSETGDFSADGLAFKRGYELWAHDVNAAGGLLGRKVKLTFLDDKSDPTQGSTNVQQLITSDHVDMLFGPFSSLITGPTASVAARYGFAMIEGAGGAPAVFDTPSNKAKHNVFDVSYPIVDGIVPLVNWIKSMPASQRPKTAAFPIINNPFTIPPEHLAQRQLAAIGVRTVYSKVLPAELPNATSDADQVAASGAQAVFLGSTAVPTVAAFMQAFRQQHYNPKIFFATSGPDQGSAFLKAVGKANANGMMASGGWYGGFRNAMSHKMVSEYLAKYGGTASDINADVAEAYGVGQVAAQAIRTTGGTNQAKIISYLHSGVSIPTVQGPVKFNALGENTNPTVLAFQWQNGTFAQVLPKGAAGSVSPQYPKANWAG